MKKPKGSAFLNKVLYKNKFLTKVWKIFWRVHPKISFIFLSLIPFCSPFLLLAVFRFCKWLCGQMFFFDLKVEGSNPAKLKASSNFLSKITAIVLTPIHLINWIWIGFWASANISCSLVMRLKIRPLSSIPKTLSSAKNQVFFIWLLHRFVQRKELQDQGLNRKRSFVKNFLYECSLKHS